jgi:hypothetical protein
MADKNTRTDDDKPAADAEAMGRQLQEKLRKQRPRWSRWVPLVAVVLFGGLVLFAWLIYPSPDPPRLTVTALDALHVEGAELHVRAVLDPERSDEQQDSYQDLEITFWQDDNAPLGPGTRHTARCDQHGQAHATLERADPAGTMFNVRHISPSKKYEARDRASVYALKKDAPLLVVEVEETLADIEPEQWSATNPLGIGIRTGAASSLKGAADKGWRVVYLAVHGARARDYRRVRGWVEIKGGEAEPLPRGPVLGRTQFAGAPGGLSQVRQEALDHLCERFKGPISAVVRTAEAAEQCLRLKIRPLAMGGGDFPEGVTRLKSWAELSAALTK